MRKIAWLGIASTLLGTALGMSGCREKDRPTTPPTTPPQPMDPPPMERNPPERDVPPDPGAPPPVPPQ